jgi:hypothetical protein
MEHLTLAEKIFRREQIYVPCCVKGNKVHVNWKRNKGELRATSHGECVLYADGIKNFTTFFTTWKQMCVNLSKAHMCVLCRDTWIFSCAEICKHCKPFTFATYSQNECVICLESHRPIRFRCRGCVAYQVCIACNVQRNNPLLCDFCKSESVAASNAVLAQRETCVLKREKILQTLVTEKTCLLKLFTKTRYPITICLFLNGNLIVHKYGQTIYMNSHDVTEMFSTIDTILDDKLNV